MTITQRDALAAQQEREIAELDRMVPGWEQREEEAMGRYLSERDFPVYDDTADEALVSNEDWEAFLEMTFVDPAER